MKVIWDDGQSASIQELWGKIAVVKVWSSWCSASREALAEFNLLAQEYKDNEDIVFVAMSTDYSRNNWEKAVNDSGLNALRHCWYDMENKLGFNRPVPYSIIFDKKNIVHADGINVDIRSELKKVIEASKEQ
jgi:thiol-disulfide isomerase/thioredoxin